MPGVVLIDDNLNSQEHMPVYGRPFSRRASQALTVNWV